MTPAEKAVLSGLLYGGAEYLETVPLQPADFSTMTGEVLFGGMLRLQEQGRPVDTVTLLDHLRGLDPAETRAATPDVVWELSSLVTPTSSLGYHAAIVAQEAARRRLVRLATEVAQAAQTGQDPEQIAEQARAMLDGVGGGLGAHLEAVTDSMDATIQDLASPPLYLETPWPSLNHYVHGWKPGALYTIGARPSVGKTVAGLQAALSLCNLGPVAYTSLEMDVTELQKRQLSLAARVDIGRITRHQLTSREREQVARYRERSPHVPLYVDPSRDATIAQVERHARALAREQGIAGVVVDYLGLLEGRRDQSEYQVVTEASRRLKRLAQELQVPVIALSQLNRSSTQREGNRPQLADLRSSGAVEQDSDVVILLHRDLMETPHELDMIVAKNRQGTTGTVTLTFAGHYSEIRDDSTPEGHYGGPEGGTVGAGIHNMPYRD